MANEKVLTAPLAVIKIGGVVIGKVRNIRVSENFSRQPVTGIGELTPSEAPPVGWNGSITCSQYSVRLNSGILGAVDRSMNTVTAFVESLLFNEGIQIDLLMKRKSGTDDNGRPIVELVTFASLKRCLLNTEGFDISEGQLSSRDASFTYLDPLVYGG